MNKWLIVSVIIAVPLFFLLIYSQTIYEKIGKLGILAKASREVALGTSNKEEKPNINKYKVASFPRTVMAVEPQKVGGNDAHVIDINSPENSPDYRYEFLSRGVRILADKKDGKGFREAVSAVKAIPEFKSNDNWRAYSLKTNTKGEKVLEGYNREDQKDGTIILTRTYSTNTENTPETFTETWTIPKTAEEFTTKGPKATYSMTKNRNAPWRMRWEISGIPDILKDNIDIRDEDNWPIRKKEYMDGLFRVDVNDFDNQFEKPMFTYSEIASGKKAEVLFYKDGTTRDRVIDPTIVTSNIASAWWHNSLNNVFYNGSNFFIFYDKGGTSLFAKAASTVAGLSGAGEQTVLNGTMASGGFWNIFMIDDSKFDIAYPINSIDGKTVTCTISGTTISCGSASTGSFNLGGAENAPMNIVRTPNGNRIWVSSDDHVFSADQIGDASGISTWTEEGNANAGGNDYAALVPYNGSDKILWIFIKDASGPSNDGFYYYVCLQSDTLCTESDIQWLNLISPPIENAGNAVRVSDTDFRYVYINGNSDVIEAKFNGASTWTVTHATVHTGTDKNPTMFYDRTGNQSYALYADSADDIWYQQKTCTSNNGCSESSWGAQVNADNNESDANTFPITQMHEAPYGSSRTAPLEFPWCYRNANASNFDIVCESVNLAPPGPHDSVKINRGVNIQGGTTIYGN